MAFKTFNGSLESLKPFLSEDIYDGEFSRDIDFSVLKEKYINYLDNCGFDIMRKGDSILIGHPLEWDSAYFGFPCYRISYLNAQYNDSLLSDIYGFLKIRKVKLAFLRLSTSDPLRLYFAQHPSFRLCSTKIMYRKKLEKPRFMGRDENTRLETLIDMPAPAKKKNEKKIEKITPLLFKANRFMADNKITKKKATGVYREWIKNSTNDRSEDIHCLLDKRGELCAFSIVKVLNGFDNKMALLELIGTLSKGKNYGALILEKISSELKREGKEIFYANTDIRNYSAQNLFSQNGFAAYHSVDEYHCWVG